LLGPSNGEVLCTRSGGESLDLLFACWSYIFYCKVIYGMNPALSVYKIKARLKLRLIKHHAVKLWGVVYSSTFVISALGSGKLPIVCPSQFKIGREPLTHTCYLMLPAYLLLLDFTGSCIQLIMCANMSEDSSAGEATVCMLYNQDLTPNRDRNFSDSYHIQACSGTHCVSLLNGYWSLVSWA